MRIVSLILVAIFLSLTVLVINPLRTLASLRLVDGHSLYVMDYYGSYFLDTFLQQRIDRNLDQIQRNIGRGGASTSFVAIDPRGDMLLARNYDWSGNKSILLYTYPTDAYSSVSMVSIGGMGFGEDGISWMELYKLFSAPYLPQDGMNEQGLGVSSMYVPCRIASFDPHKATINIHEVMRMMLDHAATVDEAIELVDDYNIYFPGMCSHHLVVDAKGDTAVLEYIDGEVVVVRNDEPWQVATNFLMTEYQPEEADGPTWSYIRTYEELSKVKGRISQDKAMDLLRDVRAGTMWSIVYNLRRGGIQLAMHWDFEKIQHFNLEVEPRRSPISDEVIAVVK